MQTRRRRREPQPFKVDYASMPVFELHFMLTLMANATSKAYARGNTDRANVFQRQYEAAHAAWTERTRDV